MKLSAPARNAAASEASWHPFRKVWRPDRWRKAPHCVEDDSLSAAFSPASVFGFASASLIQCQVFGRVVQLRPIRLRLGIPSFFRADIVLTHFGRFSARPMGRRGQADFIQTVAGKRQEPKRVRKPPDMISSTQVCGALRQRFRPPLS